MQGHNVVTATMVVRVVVGGRNFYACLGPLNLSFFCCFRPHEAAGTEAARRDGGGGSTWSSSAFPRRPPSSPPAAPP